MILNIVIIACGLLIYALGWLHGRGAGYRGELLVCREWAQNADAMRMELIRALGHDESAITTHPAGTEEAE